MKVTSWLTEYFLFDVLVLVATLQFMTSELQFQLADEEDNDNHFSIVSIETKEGKEKHNNKIFTTISWQLRKLS